MNEIKEKIEYLKTKFQRDVGAIFDISAKLERIKIIEAESSGIDFWKNHQRASEIMRELEDLKKDAAIFQEMEKQFNDLENLALIADSQEDQEELEKEVGKLEKDLYQLELKTLLGGEYDRNDAIISIYSGAGGADAQDWSEMILRMYIRWAQNNGFKSKILDETRGQEAGIKNAVLEIIGLFAYGKLKSEAGVHRLVRLSPFNANNLRQTSFALVEVIPVIENDTETDVNPNDLKIDTFRSGGAGGQSVNKTSSAVRITHIPTGIVVKCQNERSQMQNRVSAMKILKARLHQKFLNDQENKKKKIRGKQASAEWGSQIRSYVIHPYKLVKDHRTKVETADVENVLEGNLNEFMDGYLRWHGK